MVYFLVLSIKKHWSSFHVRYFRLNKLKAGHVFSIPYFKIVSCL